MCLTKPLSPCKSCVFCIHLLKLLANYLAISVDSDHTRAVLSMFALFVGETSKKVSANIRPTTLLNELSDQALHYYFICLTWLSNRFITSLRIYILA